MAAVGSLGVSEGFLCGVVFSKWINDLNLRRKIFENRLLPGLVRLLPYLTPQRAAQRLGNSLSASMSCRGDDEDGERVSMIRLLELSDDDANKD